MAAEYITTLADITQLPDLIKGEFLKGHRYPRVAMVGRSNVGKSSLINALFGTRLARISKEPGKTRAIHFYLWKEASHIVADLPGYGYARTGHDERDRWAKFINAYLRNDSHLEQALVLLDARHGPTELDREAIKFMNLESIPVTFIFTKFDTLKTQSERAQRKKEAAVALQGLGYDPDAAFWVSSRSEVGIKELAKALGLKPAKG